MSRLIIITGTPGTGKSTLARILAKKLSFKRIDLHNYYKSLSSNYNKDKQSYNIELKKLIELIKNLKKKDNLILDSHLSHLLPIKTVDLCIVLTCSDLKELEKRLKKRKYSKEKIKENLEAEIMQICLNEAREKGHKIVEIDTSKKINLGKIIKNTKFMIQL